MDKGACCGSKEVGVGEGWRKSGWVWMDGWKGRLVRLEGVGKGNWMDGSIDRREGRNKGRCVLGAFLCAMVSVTRFRYGFMPFLMAGNDHVGGCGRWKSGGLIMRYGIFWYGYFDLIGVDGLGYGLSVNLELRLRLSWWCRWCLRLEDYVLGFGKGGDGVWGEWRAVWVEMGGLWIVSWSRDWWGM